jgi:hypothetical protein
MTALVPEVWSPAATSALIAQLAAWRTHELAGGAADPWLDRSALGALAELPAHARAYSRMQLDLAAYLRADGYDVPIWIADIGFGGALVHGAHGAYPGELLDLVIDDAGTSYRFKACVRWVTTWRAGLAFVGAPLRIARGR